MQKPVKPRSRKRSVNLSVDAELLGQAKAAGANLSTLFEQALREEIRRKDDAAWREANRPAIEAHNRFIEEHGLLSDEWRKF